MQILRYWHSLENVYTILSSTKICLDMTCVNNNSFCACICMCTCVCVCICMRFGVCICMRTCVCICECTCVCICMHIFVYVYDISTALKLMILTCIFSDFIWCINFRYCMFLVLPFYSLMFFYSPFNVAFILIFCMFALFYMSVHCQKWRK